MNADLWGVGQGKGILISQCEIVMRSCCGGGMGWLVESVVFLVVSEKESATVERGFW